MKLQLLSHHLCPYVQRAVISLTEKGVPFEKTMIDLARKPRWFLEISPLGKTPVLVADGRPVFESAVILEFLEETQPNPLHPDDPKERARHRSWIEVGSAVLNDIAGLYSARESAVFEAKRRALGEKFTRVERELGQGPWFAGADFSLVDAVYGPVFRYFDTFDRIVDLRVFDELPKVRSWRANLSRRPSVAGAVGADYPDRLRRFLLERDSFLTLLMRDRAA